MSDGTKYPRGDWRGLSAGVAKCSDAAIEASKSKSGSDPTPTIRSGITLHVRDIRVILDRPDFTLNPTGCGRMALDARLTGTGADFANPADNAIATPSNPFQASNCAALPFKLKGRTKRGQFPAFQATLRARPGDATSSARSAPGPVRGPSVSGGIDLRPRQGDHASVRRADRRAGLPAFQRRRQGSSRPCRLLEEQRDRGGLRRLHRLDQRQGPKHLQRDPQRSGDQVVLNMRGGKRGLLVNHLDLCEVTSRADVKMVGQNGKVSESQPKMGTPCSKSRKGKRDNKTAQ